MNRQDSTFSQLKDVIDMAEENGCYDVADWIKRKIKKDD